MRPRSHRSFCVRAPSSVVGHLRLDDGVRGVRHERAVEQQLHLQLDVLGQVVAPLAAAQHLRRGTPCRCRTGRTTHRASCGRAGAGGGAGPARRPAARRRRRPGLADAVLALDDGAPRRRRPRRSARRNARIDDGVGVDDHDDVERAERPRPEHPADRPLQRRALAAGLADVLVDLRTGRPAIARPSGRCSGRRRRAARRARPGSPAAASRRASTRSPAPRRGPARGGRSGWWRRWPAWVAAGGWHTTPPPSGPTGRRSARRRRPARP